MGAVSLTYVGVAVLAEVLRDRGEHVEAEQLSRVALARREVLGKDYSDTLTGFILLALVLHSKREQLIRRALRREVLSDRHPDTVESMAELVETYHAQGRHSDATTIFIEVLALRREILGDKHPETIRSMVALATTYYQQGRYGDAEKPHTEALSIFF